MEVSHQLLAEEQRTNRLKAFANGISHRVFEYVTDCDLLNFYTKASTEYFVRHLLVIAKQQPKETFDEVKLQKLARDCYV